MIFFFHTLRTHFTETEADGTGMSIIALMAGAVCRGFGRLVVMSEAQLAVSRVVSPCSQEAGREGEETPV